MNIAINVFYIFPIMLALYLMLSMTYYAKNYAGIIGGSLLGKLNKSVILKQVSSTFKLARLLYNTLII